MKKEKKNRIIMDDPRAMEEDDSGFTDSWSVKGPPSYEQGVLQLAAPEAGKRMNPEEEHILFWVFFFFFWLSGSSQNLHLLRPHRPGRGTARRGRRRPAITR